MTAPVPTHRARRTPRAVLGVLALLAALVAAVVPTGSAQAVASPQADAANAWLAAQVAADGSVAATVPGVASVNDAVNVSLSLAMTGTQDAALQRALGYVQANVEAYVDEGSGDLAGRLGYLILLADAVGLDPTAFGTPATDLVARLEALHGATEAGFYGTPNIFSATTDQSLAILALVAVGAPVPADAVTWLTDQQCTAGGTTPAEYVGAWQGYRATVGGVLEDCLASGVAPFNSADTNSTALALQALAATGTSTGVGPALDFLRSAQVASGGAAGGFEFAPGYGADPNSTAVVIQAIVALGEDPTSSSWQAGGASPLDALASFVLTDGADAGALEAPFDPGRANFLATYQGVWGLTQTSFPFTAVTPAPTPTTTTTSPAPGTVGGDDGGTGGDQGGTGGTTGSSNVVRPSFTG